jgi:hypothetical protein
MMEIGFADSHIPTLLRRSDVRKMNHDRGLLCSTVSMGDGGHVPPSFDQRVMTKGTGPLPPWPTRGAQNTGQENSALDISFDLIEGHRSNYFRY